MIIFKINALIREIIIQRFIEKLGKIYLKANSLMFLKFVLIYWALSFEKAEIIAII